MSGHSKWNNIKNKKAKGDAVRSKIFTKIGREIAVAVKAGGPDPDTNSKLYDIVQKAKANNMPNDNITRSIKKASGELSAVDYFEITYEGYGSGGVAVIVDALTDNKNRTAAAVRHIFDKCGGSLGTTNCVSYMFEEKGINHGRARCGRRRGRDNDGRARSRRGRFRFFGRRILYIYEQIGNRQRSRRTRKSWQDRAYFRSASSACVHNRYRQRDRGEDTPYARYVRRKRRRAKRLSQCQYG